MKTNTKISNACLGVSIALDKRSDAPIFSSSFWTAELLLENEIKRLNALLVRYKVIDNDLTKSDAINYAIQVTRTSY